MKRKGKMSVKKVGDTTVVKYTMPLTKKQKAQLAVMVKPFHGPLWFIQFFPKTGAYAMSPIMYFTE